MEISEEIVLPATVEKVYNSLNDINILKECIPGCEDLIRQSDTRLEAKVILKIGPVKANFSGHVILNKENAPGQFSLSGEGDGGIAGFAKGGAFVELKASDDGTGTILKYTAKAETGGKIAQLGSRLITSTARKLSKSFFANFENVIKNGFSKKPLKFRNEQSFL